jgi:hypothetical protein
VVVGVGRFGVLQQLAICGAFGVSGTNVLLRGWSSLSKLKFLFLKSLYDWCSASLYSTDSLMDFLDDLRIAG